jgi:hypothetical protein
LTFLFSARQLSDSFKYKSSAIYMSPVLIF